MKKTIALLLVVLLLMLTLVGCGEKDRLNYVKGLKDYVDLCDIENLTVDLKSEDYLESYKNALNSDLNSLPYAVEEGTVEDGDITNIDFEGKVDGVPFEGGTAAGYELTIGSGQFIDGFEEQLIGVKIGDTVDVNVTFPADYHEPTLAGADAVFTVTVNSVKRPFAEVNDEFAAAAGFETKEAYLDDLQKRCVKNYITDYIVNNSSVKSVPADKEGNCYDYHKNYYTDMAQYYGYTFETFLSANGLDEASFKKEILTQEIIMYACFDALGLEVTADAVATKTEDIAKLNDVTVEEVKEAYGENYIEYVYVNNAAIEKIYEKVTIVE